MEDTVGKDAFGELALMRGRAFDTNGERKTVIIGESDDFFVPLPRLVGPTASPFLRPRRRRQ
jgi:hypothetical protein